MGGDQEKEGGGGEREICCVRLVVAAKVPVGECACGECDCSEEKRIAEGAHGLRVEIEKVAERECVVGWVLFEE